MHRINWRKHFCPLIILRVSLRSIWDLPCWVISHLSMSPPCHSCLRKHCLLLLAVLSHRLMSVQRRSRGCSRMESDKLEVSCLLVDTARILMRISRNGGTCRSLHSMHLYTLKLWLWNSRACFCFWRLWQMWVRIFVSCYQQHLVLLWIWDLPVRTILVIFLVKVCPNSLQVLLQAYVWACSLQKW